jgi:hypothetical protein
MVTINAVGSFLALVVSVLRLWWNGWRYRRGYWFKTVLVETMEADQCFHRYSGKVNDRGWYGRQRGTMQITSIYGCLATGSGSFFATFMIDSAPSYSDPLDCALIFGEVEFPK